MKKLLLLSLVFVSALGFSQTKKSYTITGSVKGIKDTISKVYVRYAADGAVVSDSAVITAGKFSFKGTLAQPVQASIYVKFDSKKMDYDKDLMSIFIQPGIPITITCLNDSFSKAVVKGGPMNVEWQKIQAGEKKFDDQSNPLYDVYTTARKAKNKPVMDSVEKIIDAIDSTKKEEVYAKYIKKNPASPIAVYILRSYAGYSIDPNKIEPLYNKLPAAQKTTADGKWLKGQIDVAKLTAIGKPAMNFTQNDTLDNPVSLANFKGKYVLLDFWASWCGPCRAENPNVVAAYNKYKDKGFSILSVSLDQPGAKEKWMKAIHDDNLTWTHVSDLKFWDNAVAKEYGIQAIPQNFLIDPNGVIVGKDLRGEALEQKLEALFPN
jgi:peroxiredoxin